MRNATLTDGKCHYVAASHSLQMTGGGHITSHRRRPNTSHTSHHSSAVTKQHDRIKAEGRDEPEREHVWVEEKDARKIKGCARFTAMCMIVLTLDPLHPPRPPPPLKKTQILCCFFQVEGKSTMCEKDPD